MAELTEHQGGCHCGKVRYRVTLDLDQVLACNCSICQKRGALWSYVDPKQFTLLSGAHELADYQFNKRIIHHLFCRTCGVASFARGRGADGAEGIGINVRCLDDVDLGALELTAFDGKSM